MLLGGSRMFKNTQSFKVEYFECQTKGVMSDSILQNWTLSAFECYKLNCKCKNCPIKKAGYSFKCKMKYVVEELLKTKGLPNEAEILGASSIVA